MKKAISLVMALAMAGSALVACGNAPANVAAPTTTTTPATTTSVEFDNEIKVVNLAANDQVAQFAEVPYTNAKLEETVQIHEMTVRIYSYTNDGLNGIFLTDQLGHTYDLYGESEFYVNDGFNIGFGATQRFEDSAYLWVYPEDYGFMTVCHPNK